MTTKRLLTSLCSTASFISLWGQVNGSLLNYEIPSNWASESELYLQTSPVEEQWWSLFDDPTLDSLINVAINENFTVEGAITRLEQARMNLYIEQGGWLPSLTTSGGWQRQQTSGNAGSSRSWSGSYNLTANMSWEIDVFGNIRNRVKAQRENFRATEEEIRDVKISLCAQVATTYFQLRQYQQELEVLNHNCESQRSVVLLTEARNKSGLASKLDVAQARQVYYATLSQVPSMEANITQAMNQIAVLLGTIPQNTVTGLSDFHPLPSSIEPIGIDIPAGLLRRRPDVRQAERQVYAQTALLGVAKSEWLPQFFLNGSLGFSSEALKNLPRTGSLAWEIAPTMTWTLFNGGQRYNNIRLNRAKLDEAISQYNQTVLQAIQEAYNAMAIYKNSIKQIVATRQAFNQSEQALMLSLDLYKQGLTTFQNVLDAQRSLLNDEESLVQIQGYSLVSLVNLYQSLGGGFETWSGNNEE